MPTSCRLQYRVKFHNYGYYVIPKAYDEDFWMSDTLLSQTSDLAFSEVLVDLGAGFLNAFSRSSAAFLKALDRLHLAPWSLFLQLAQAPSNSPPYVLQSTKIPLPLAQFVQACSALSPQLWITQAAIHRGSFWSSFVNSVLGFKCTRW